MFQKMKITLCAAITSDGFIADSFNNGDFSSKEDKKQFREFLHSDKIDAFIIGRKTFEEFGNRISFKPIFVLSNSSTYKNSFNNADILPKNLNYALLGGGKCYHYFLERGLVNEARITIEKNLLFKKGIALDFNRYKPYFGKPSVFPLSSSTDLLTYSRLNPLMINSLYNRER